MLYINPYITIPENEIQCDAIRAQGAGGQNVNKVSSAVHLRFDIKSSSLPNHVKHKLLGLSDSRISKDGVIIIKAQRFRTRQKNIDDAKSRLKAIIRNSVIPPKKRKPTKPSKRSQTKRVDKKVKHGKLKKLRNKVPYNGTD